MNIQIEVLGNKYNSDGLTIGNVIDIESRKVTYSNSKYGEMVRSHINSVNTAVDLAEMTASFSVVFPKFIDELKVKSIFDLKIEHAKELLKVYKDIFIPWYTTELALLSLDEENSEIK